LAEGISCVLNIVRATEAAIRAAADLLRNGGVVVFPTDTVYGVGARAADAAAVARLFTAKQRPRDRAIPVLLASARDLPLVGVALSPAARSLARAFWPGGLTLVVRRAPSFRSAALVGDTVAVRVPDHPVARLLIELAGEPLAATSANVSGKPSPLTAEEAARQIGEAVDMVIDGGPAPGGIESTVVDTTVEPPRVLREGAIRRSTIERVAGALADPADDAIE